MLAQKVTCIGKKNLAPLTFEERRFGALRKELRRIMALMQKHANATACRIIVPGVIRPGVEISIGRQYTKINDYLENVTISLRNGELVFESPAIHTK